ncbi:hypothetical protein MXB_3974 [Myxobolus squamalis]|nr:hypothetical protein MXB_3974 [Myxobolus squamalis]
MDRIIQKNCSTVVTLKLKAARIMILYIKSVPNIFLQNVNLYHCTTIWVCFFPIPVKSAVYYTICEKRNSTHPPLRDFPKSQHFYEDFGPGILIENTMRCLYDVLMRHHLSCTIILDATGIYFDFEISLISAIKHEYPSTRLLYNYFI